MAHRYSRTDRGKAKSDSFPLRKPLVRVPDSDVSELIDHRDVNKARLRILINGLEPLVMKMGLQLPSREIVEVELEYEKIEKHCFYCKALTHEEGNCPHRSSSRSQDDGKRPLGITQQNTLERIGEARRRQDDRKTARQFNSTHYGDVRWTNTRNNNWRADTAPSKETISRGGMDRSSGFEENQRRFDDRRLQRESSQRDPSATWIPREGRTLSTRVHNSQGRSQPMATPPRERHRSHPREASSKSIHSPVTRSLPGVASGNMATRLSSPRGSQVSSEERLSVKTIDLPLHHDQADQNAEDSLQPLALYSITRPSSSNVFESGRLGPCERSPIRTLSEDRLHVSLRIGPLNGDGTEESDDSAGLHLHDVVSAKAAGKRIASTSLGMKRVARSPNQGIPLKRRRTTKVHSSPRRKLMLDAITTGGRRGKKTIAAKSTAAIIPAMDEALLKHFRKSNLTNHFTVPPVGLTGGLSLSWRDDIKVNILYSSPNIIDTRIEAQGTFSFIRELVKEQWQQDPLESVFKKLGNIRHNIIRWTREQNINSNLKIQSTQQDLEQALSSSIPDAALISALTAELENAYKEEESYWRQRSRILWLQCGDRNTSYFHAATRGRRAINNFSVMENLEGKAFFKEEEIVHCVSEYYSHIFTEQMSDSSLVVHEGISPLRRHRPKSAKWQRRLSPSQPHSAPRLPMASLPDPTQHSASVHLPAP
ncbi:hypothetical protein Bca52824_061357 [Brassica carinata]|uniref:Zinc knuckle CX2CX4HX4C domain-containing protein n=1 Tax=Brassica carinata TaxID=52824 RepID=A0A8X7QZP4_BRACI|nr:hypothetical protein Bca52824_061357 [Brassica carinata]